MISIKTKEEIETVRQGGKILAEILEKIKKEVKPGVATIELDKFGEKLITQAGGDTSFKMVRDYQWTTCMCVNEVVVHGIPDKYNLKEGDLLGIDIGILYKGFHSDMAETVIVPAVAKASAGKQNEEKENFLEVGKEALAKAVGQAKVGNRVGHISQAIQKTLEAAGFSPVRALVGHGIGRKLHEEPSVPCLLRGNIEETPRLEEGMMLAIEVIYNQGSPEVVYKNNDGWTIRTADGKLSGLFEKTIAILSTGPEILTLRHSSA